MATKIFAYKSLGNIDCATYTQNRVCGGDPYSTTTRELSLEVKCTATFSRPRPTRLTPTSMSWRYSLHQGVLDWNTSVCHGAPLRGQGSAKGTLRYCASSWVQNRLFNSKPLADSLITKARAKQTTQFASIAETVFESRSTASMISKSIRRVAQMALYLRRGHWRSLSEQFKVDVPSSLTRLRPTRRLADGWLELEFGWKPLLQTAYDAMSAYERRIQRGQYVRASSGTPVSSNDWETRATNARAGKLAARATHCGFVRNVGVVTLASMGFLSPAQIAWNLLPYSFVLDWFSDTGRALAALSSDFGLSDVRIVQTYENGTVTYPTRAYSDSVAFLDLLSHRVVSVDNTPIQAFWKPASVTNWRIATSLALLRQRFHGPL